MDPVQEIDELKARRICEGCVEEHYLRTEIRRDGRDDRCSYCDRRGKTYSMNKMAERIEEAFSDHYLRTEEPDFWDGERAGERAGDPVIWAIAGAAHISEQAAEDVQLILEDKHDDFESAQMGDETEFSRGPTMKRPAQRAEACLD